MIALTQVHLSQLEMCKSYATDVYYFYLKDYAIRVEDFLFANAIQSLSERNQLIILFFLLDMSNTEIAKELGEAMGTVYYHKQKALEKIKNYIKEHENE